MRAERIKFGNYEYDPVATAETSPVKYIKTLTSHIFSRIKSLTLVRFQSTTKKLSSLPFNKTFSVMNITVKGLLQKLQSSLSRQRRSRSDMPKQNQSKMSSRQIIKLLLIPGSLILLFLVLRSIFNWNVGGFNSGKDQRVEVLEAKAEMEVNRDFEFPLRASDGEEISKIKYTIEKAEIRDQFIHQGKRATAIKGRTFVILNLKITNQYEKSIDVYTRNYVRLTVNNNSDEMLAPTMYNDPVEVQAISTKYTRIGFPIYDTDKDLKLIVGEISGDKDEILLDYLN